MKTISMLEFKKNSKQVISFAKQGVSMVMTYRGKPVLRLLPLSDNKHSADDPFYRLSEMAEKGDSLSHVE